MKETALRIASTDDVQLDARLTQTEVTPKGMIVLVHGIASEKEEGGLYTRLAAALADAGFHSLRFDFRGHGQSSGSSVDMTIRGETEDLSAAIACARQHCDAPLGILAASFGTVSTMNYLKEGGEIHTLVLWNPVLDLQHTFTHPQMPWGKALFSEEKRMEMEQTGKLHIGTHAYGRALFDEMASHFPYRVLEGLTVPVLTVHGDRDEITSYDLSMRYGAPNANSETLTLPGVGHGFGTKSGQAVEASVAWFSRWMA
ncbi:MAG: alpha/beta fold hydrolase [Oscillospiraceae bacterium]|nr:alpha/beta fold hydrolase [Oscillospiraceae bacterium]